jgi:hypothetical protein
VKIQQGAVHIEQYAVDRLPIHHRLPLRSL